MTEDIKSRLIELTEEMEYLRDKPLTPIALARLAYISTLVKELTKNVSSN